MKTVYLIILLALVGWKGYHAWLRGRKSWTQDMQQYQSLYGIVLQDPLAAEYLQSEMAFSQIVADIYGIIGDAIK